VLEIGYGMGVACQALVTWRGGRRGPPLERAERRRIAFVEFVFCAAGPELPLCGWQHPEPGAQGAQLFQRRQREQRLFGLRGPCRLASEMGAGQWHDAVRPVAAW